MALQDECTNSSYINTYLLFLFTSPMEGRENSKALHGFSYEQGQYTSSTTNSHIHYSNNLECNVIKKERINSNTNFFVPAPKEQHCFEMSDSDSCSDATDEEEVSLEELLNDGKTKKKIEQLAAMVGVDTTEPAIVLTQVTDPTAWTWTWRNKSEGEKKCDSLVIGYCCGWKVVMILVILMTKPGNHIVTSHSTLFKT
ncbi:hypothetical protein CR513_20678, partial [Mucuna pruriens]